MLFLFYGKINLLLLSSSSIFRQCHGCAQTNRQSALRSATEAIGAMTLTPQMSDGVT